MKTLEMAMKKKTFVHNIHLQFLLLFRYLQKGEIIMDKHQTHLAAQLMKDSSDFILNTSSEQLTAIKKQSHLSDFYLARIKY
jgi:hypothetical protein